MVLIVALLIGLLAPVGPARQTPADPPPGLSPEVAALPASSRTLDAAETRRDAALATRDRDRSELAETQEELATATRTLGATTSLLGRRAADAAKTDASLVRHREALRAIAAEWFVAGTADQQSMDPTLGAEELAALRRQAVLGDAAAEAAGASVAFLSARARTLAAEVEDLERERAHLTGRIEELQRRSDKLVVSSAAAEQELVAAEADVAAARLNATVDGVDISTIALDAYWRAQRSLATSDPDCGASWWMLAGIGRTESRHGTYLGSEVAPGGRVEPPILGPPLDGSNGFRRVPDSDGGALDGDPVNDRAVGPMQFLPGTWATMGRDGDGDGTADPDNIYDAALGAGAYLCRSGPLSSEAALRGAYLTYNRSQTYVDTVLGFAQDYRDAVALPGA